MRTGQGHHDTNGAATPAMALSAPAKPFCAPCGSVILYHDTDDVVTCQSCGKPWTVPAPTPPTVASIRAGIVAELEALAVPQAELFWKRYVEQKTVRGILRMGWRPFADWRRKLEIDVVRLTPPEGQRELFMTVEDARAIIRAVVSVD